MAALVEKGHALGLTVGWYGNACACSSENAYSSSSSPTIDMAIKGTVADTVAYGFDGLKLDRHVFAVFVFGRIPVKIRPCTYSESDRPC